MTNKFRVSVPVKFNAYCKCGGQIKGETPKDIAEDMIAAFRQLHNKPQCGKAGPEECRLARITNDEKMI